MRSSTPTVIATNVVADAFGTAVFTAGIGFFVLSSSDFSAGTILRFLSVGAFIGVGVSYFTGPLLDKYGPRALMLKVQPLQAACYLVLPFVSDSLLLLFLCAGGAALSRLLSPARGALPPMYLGAQDLVAFKARVKIWTVAAAISGAALSAVLVGAHSRRLLYAVPAINGASFVVAASCTFCLPSMDGSRGVPTGLYKPSSTIMAAGLTLAILLALADVPETAVPLLTASYGTFPTFLVVVTPASSFIAALAGQVLVKGRRSVFGRNLGAFVVVITVAVVAAVGCLLVAPDFRNNSTLVIISVVLSAVLGGGSGVFVSYLIWDSQYSLGPDQRRGSVVAIFVTATSVALAGSPALASAILFQGNAVALIVSTALLACLCVSGNIWRVGRRRAQEIADADTDMAVGSRLS